MMGSPGDDTRFVIAGCLNRDFILPISGPPQIDILGGNLTYAAVGLNLWQETGGLLARVGEDFPVLRLGRFDSLGFDLSGVNVLSQSMDVRRFMAYEGLKTTYTQSPIQHFADRGLAFPPELLGYRDVQSSHASRRTPMKHTIQIYDVPAYFLECSAVHICPIDYLTHSLLPAILRQAGFTFITLDPPPGYMVPAFRLISLIRCL